MQTIRLEFLTVDQGESSRMYIVAIAWIYVVGVMAASEGSVAAGALTLLLYCVLPLAVVALVTGRRKPAQPSDEMPDRDVDQDDRADPKADQ